LEIKNKSHKDAKIKLDNILVNGDKFCKNFIFPKEKLKEDLNLSQL